MLTTLKYRQQVAVLAALAMVASVLVAAPAVAADPKPSLSADFSACVDVGTSDFEDVPANHSSAGSIGCIAYYGITQGTSATTYSPLMSVSREHMALFLTRLASRVGIEMPADPPDAGFTDIGDLSLEAQTAINQLADLGITKGTSLTTYGPDQAVKRGQMALFLARLMDKMIPIGGKDSAWGHTPSDLADLDKDDVGSPYTDLGSTTKEAYDAITALYELGVASGISATAYAPDQAIIRAHMADFMAGVMGHSNLRPSGVTIQASSGDYGPINNGTVVISVRDDSFAPVADQAVDYFNSEADGGGLVKGQCADEGVTGDCEWNEDDDFTAANGNLVLSGETVTEGMTNVFYAWIGDKNGAKFDANKVDYDSASITSKKDEEALKATSTINKEATGDRVDLDKVDSVTITVQLVDTADTTTTPPSAADGAKNVARSGQKITVMVSQSSDTNSDGDSDDTGEGSVFSSTNVATLTTDDDGKVTYTVEGPKDDNDNDDIQLGQDLDDDPDVTDPADETEVANLEGRIDEITFTYVTADNKGTPEATTVQYTIRWSERNSVTTKAKASASDFVIVEADGDARPSATVTFFDQYGNGFRQAAGQQVGIEYGEETNSAGDAIDPVANVNGNGVARRSKTLEDQSAGNTISVNYTEDPNEAGTGNTDTIDIPADVEDDLNTASVVQVVTRADTDSSDAGSKMVHTLFADDNEFTTEVGGTETNAANADTLYSYDSDDTYIMDGGNITMDKFEDLLANQPAGTLNDAVVNIVHYNPDGVSIFEVTADSDPNN